MTIGDMFGTALSNLGRRKVRTALTSVGVVVGILTIVTMVSLGVGVQAAIRTQFEALGLENVFVRPKLQESDDFFTQFGPPSRVKPITPALVEAWRKLPGVRTVTPTIELTEANTLLDMAAPGAAPRLHRVQLSGPALVNNPFARPAALVAGVRSPSEPGTMVLTRDLLPNGQDAAALIGQERAIVLQSPRGEQQRFVLRIVGILDSDEGEAELMSDDMAQMKAWWFNTPDYLASQGYDTAIIRTTDVAVASRLVRDLRAEDFRVQSLELILDAANRAFAVINVMLSSVGGLALFVASLGIVNTMLMSIYERTREIGTLKAIGASRGDIRGLFMIEAGMIGLLGGVIGVIGGWLLGILLNIIIQWYIEREQLPLAATFFVTPPWLALAALGFAAFVGIIAGLYPAARAARLDPLVALRYE